MLGLTGQDLPAGERDEGQAGGGGDQELGHGQEHEEQRHGQRGGQRREPGGDLAPRILVEYHLFDQIVPNKCFTDTMIHQKNVSP